MLIRSHHLPLLSLVLTEAAERYWEAFGPASPAGKMFAALASQVDRGGRIDLDEVADERPKRKARRCPPSS